MSEYTQHERQYIIMLAHRAKKSIEQEMTEGVYRPNGMTDIESLEAILKKTKAEMIKNAE